MDIFKDSCEEHTGTSLELERFKAKIREIWSMMLAETYKLQYNSEDEESMSEEEYMEHNALRFADEPEPESELDSIMEMLEGLLEPDEELERVQSEGKAPTYKGSELKSNKEKGKTEATVYEFKSKSTKTPSDSRSKVKGGSYNGVPSSPTIKRDTSTKHNVWYTPLVEEFIDELKRIADKHRGKQLGEI